MKSRVLIFLSALTAAVCLAGCSQKAVESSEAETEEIVTETETETVPEETEPIVNAPFPEADPNALDFSDGKCDFVSIVVDDKESAEGELSVENVDGNYMLKFTDKTTNKDNVGTIVQKMRFDVSKLLDPEQLGNVYTIEFDIYGEATADYFVNDDGLNLKVPGWIGGGGGTDTCDGKWYGFTDFSGMSVKEYDLERSDAFHVQFMFKLASLGKTWENGQEDVYLQIMRWGIQNQSNTYIDNLTFYDADGNSIPLRDRSADVEEETAEAEGEETVEAEETAEAAETEDTEAVSEETETEEASETEEAPEE